MKRLLLAVVALTGCGTDTHNIDTFIGSMAAELCAWEFNCCTDSEIQAKEGKRFADERSCADYRALDLEYELYLNRIAAQRGLVQLDAGSVTSCLATLKARTNACNVVVPKYGGVPLPDACNQAFVGKTAAGDACEFGGECAPGSRCITSGSVGVCVPYQKEGEPCNYSYDCDPAVAQLYCATYDYRCHLRAKLGDPCVLTTNVVGQPMVGAECDNPSGDIYCNATVGVCMRYVGPGGACSAMPQLGSQPYQCNPAFGLTCLVGSVDNGYCVTNPACGVCAADQYCNTTLVACQPKLDDGAPCTSDASCKSNSCPYSSTKQVCYPVVLCNGR
jgi:hypothetical protein